MNKIKTVVFLGALMSVSAVFAWPCYGPGWHHPGYYHHYDGWGRGGCNFWPGFIGGVVGGLVGNAISRPATTVAPTVVQPTVVTTPVVVQPQVVTAPVVVQQPQVVTTPVVSAPVTTVQNVWVEGRYVDVQQANGTVVRTWQPGHYESRTVTVQ